MKMHKAVGLLTPYAEGGHDAQGYRVVRCRCACGNAEVLVRVDDLRTNTRRTCWRCAEFIRKKMDPMTRDLIAGQLRDTRTAKARAKVVAAKNAARAGYEARFAAAPGFVYRMLTVLRRVKDINGAPEFALSCACGRQDYVLTREAFASGKIVCCGCAYRKTKR